MSPSKYPSVYAQFFNFLRLNMILGCSGHCKNTKWLIGRSTVEGFKLGNLLGQQRQGFVKLNNLGESDEDEPNVDATFA